MGVLSRWMEQRRLKKLEEINKELETLKRDPAAILDRQKKKSRNFVDVSTKRDSSMGVFILIILAIAIIVGLSIFYWMRFNDLNDEYKGKAAELDAANSMIANLTLMLNETESQLEFKEKVEEDLSDKYTDLQNEIDDLTAQIQDMNDTLTERELAVKDLQLKIQEKDKRLNEIENCIENDTISDKEDCI